MSWWLWLGLGIILGHVMMFAELVGLGKLRKRLRAHLLAQIKEARQQTSRAGDEKMPMGETAVAVLRSDDGETRTIREKPV